MRFGRRVKQMGAVVGVALGVALLGPISPAPATVGSGIGWHVVCAKSHSAQVDPIVSPGEMSMHMHDFYGNTGTDENSTTNSLLADGTTCSDSLDHSAYWVPQLSYKGVPKPASQIIVYYRAQVSPSSSIQSIPAGLRIIAGNAMAMSAQSTSVVSWSCNFDKARTKPINCGSTKVVTAKIRFPSCWDGVNLDSADHQSHLAYEASSACPAGYPVALPKIFMDLKYMGVHDGTKVTLSSGSSYGLHADIFFAWQADEMDRLVDQCMHAAINCGKASSMMK